MISGDYYWHVVAFETALNEENITLGIEKGDLAFSQDSALVNSRLFHQIYSHFFLILDCFEV